jgi:lipopolysaccharide biosynthesis glycosyltransferase
MDVMNIVCCTDHNYVMPTGIMLKSLAVNHPGQHLQVFCVVDPSVTTRDFNLLEISFGSEIHFCSYHAEMIPSPQIGITNKHVTAAAYLRLFLTEILPSDITKVIYLDGDTIVRGPLNELWETDIENYALGVVKDMDECPNLLRVDYPQKYGYFNSGVLLINLIYWRGHHLQERFLKCMKENGEKLIYHDQDVLNFILYNEKLFLSPKWNAQNGFFFRSRFQLFSKTGLETEIQELREVRRNPRIVHFTLSKPWKKYSVNPYKKDFLRYKRMSPWRNYPPSMAKNGLFSILRSSLKLLLKYKW